MLSEGVQKMRDFRDEPGMGSPQGVSPFYRAQECL
jgi:hypothetical protein